MPIRRGHAAILRTNAELTYSVFLPYLLKDKNKYARIFAKRLYEVAYTYKWKKQPYVILND